MKYIKNVWKTTKNGNPTKQVSIEFQGGKKLTKFIWILAQIELKINISPTPSSLQKFHPSKIISNLSPNWASYSFLSHL